MKLDMTPIKTETEGRFAKIPQILFRHFTDTAVHWSIQYNLQQGTGKIKTFSLNSWQSTKAEL
jgi:hypothetical protein